MRGILSTNLNLTGQQSIAGGVTITGASNWNELRNKPFETLSEDFTVENGALELASVPVAEVEWDSITAKPFSTIDYETGLTVYDNTLMIDTLDTIATIDYVNSQIPDTSDFVTAEALTPYVEASSLSPVAFSGSYNDLSNTPTIPVVPTNVSAFTNDAGYVTDSITTGLATEGYVDYRLEDCVKFIDLEGYATESYVNSAVGNISYNDLNDKPSIPTVSAQQGLTTGITVGSVTIDGSTTVFYAPEGGGSSLEPDNLTIELDGNGKLSTVIKMYDGTAEYTCPVLNDFTGGTINDQNYCSYLADTQTGTLNAIISYDNTQEEITINMGTSAVSGSSAITSIDFSTRTVSGTFSSISYIAFPDLERIYTDYQAYNMAPSSNGWGSLIVMRTKITGSTYDAQRNAYTMNTSSGLILYRISASLFSSAPAQDDVITIKGYLRRYSSNREIDGTDANHPISYVINEGSNAVANYNGGSYEYQIDTITVGHIYQLPVKYVPIDNSTIVSNGQVISASLTWSNMTGKPAIATSSGTNSIIEGLLPGGEYNNVASGAYAHAEGYRTIAGGNYSHAEGYGTNASSYQHVQGKHNVGGLIYADIIGNGSDENNESNAEATDWYGNKYLAGCIYFNVSDWNDPQNNSTKLATIPECPTDTDGTYTLQATVSDGEVSYSWVQQI